MSALADRDSRERGHRDQLSRSADAAGRDQGDRAGHPGHERAVLVPAVVVSDCLRGDVRRRRQADGRRRHPRGLPRDHAVLVAGVREPRAGDERGHAGRQPAAARHGRRRRISRRDARRRGVVSGPRALHRHGHRQRRDSRRWSRRAAAARAGGHARGLACGLLPHRGDRSCVGVLVVDRVPAARAPPAARQRRAIPACAGHRGGPVARAAAALARPAAAAPDVGTRRCQVPERRGLVLLPVLAAEVPLRCARLRHQGGRGIRLDSVRRRRRRLSRGRIALELAVDASTSRSIARARLRWD